MSKSKWNNYTLAGDGNYLRRYAKEHNLFLYPYDISTGSDIVLLEPSNEQSPSERQYIICTLSEIELNNPANTIYPYAKLSFIITSSVLKNIKISFRKNKLKDVSTTANTHANCTIDAILLLSSA